MSRPFAVLVAWFAFVPAAAVLAADGPTGAWKFAFTEGDKQITLLFHFSESDGKWVGDYVGSTAQLTKEPKFGDVTVTGNQIKFSLLFGAREFLAFDGIVAKDGKKILGSYSLFGGPLKLGELYPSKLKKLDDSFALARETVAQRDGGPELFDAGLVVLADAAKKKLTADEVRAVADKVGKAAAEYGPRWERTTALRIANSLAGQEGYADAAVAQAQKVERMLPDDPPAAMAMEVYETLAKSLEKAGKAADAKKYAALVARLENQDYADALKAMVPYAVEEYKGRKAKSDRAVLLEVFTTAEAPQAAPGDAVVEALRKAYKPSELIVLDYHLMAQPVPDALASPDAMDRVETYAAKITGLPAAMVDGKAAPRISGPAASLKDRVTAIRELVDADLEKPATAKLELAVAKAEKGFTATAKVADLAEPGEKVFLRFALAEERVRFPGNSGTKYHPYVVRAMPGGAKGFALTKKAHEETVTVDPDAIRTKLGTFLDDFAKSEGEFPRADRNLGLKNLKLIAFVQNDATGEVLNAVQVDLK